VTNPSTTSLDEPAAKPVVVIVGRPNVGKSTLFNRLTRRASALVADQPGLTRDRQYGEGKVGDRPYWIVDTGGVVEGLHGGGESATLADLVRRQTRQALAEADAVILLTDARSGIHPLDRQIADDLRRFGKPIFVAVNKAEGMPAETAVAEFYALGLGEPVAVSAAHGDGVAALMERVLATLPVVAEEAPTPRPEVPHIAVVGRPNAGKSTLVNALLGEERVVVSEEPGTTRDSVHVPLERDGKRYVLVDTAGVRRRARIHDAIERFSALRALEAIAEANVVILVIDAQAGATDQDANLAGYVLAQGRAVVVAVNKWDLIAPEERARRQEEIEHRLAFLDFARFHYISALHGTGVAELFSSVDRAYASARATLPTARLNRLLAQALAANPPPLGRGRRIRIKFAHLGGKNPPRIILYGNQLARLPAAYRRYLANFFRRAFRLEGTPIEIECREGENPYAGRRASRAEEGAKHKPKRPKSVSGRR
jgi:GTP-binding protein